MALLVYTSAISHFFAGGPVPKDAGREPWTLPSLENAWKYALGVEEGVNCYRREAEPDEGGNYYTDDLKPLHPNLVVPADGLEHAPESVGEMQENRAEPDDVDCENPPAGEGLFKKHVRVFSLSSGELHQLHVSPEMGEMEEDDPEDDDAQHEHILRRPRVSSGAACHLVTLHTSASLVIEVGKVDAVDDVDKDSEGQDRDHDRDDGGGHEVTSCREDSIAGTHKFVGIYIAPSALE